jgi:uncharacterized YigZ family protein
MPSVTKHIKVIESFSEFKFKEKGSAFIGQVYPIASVEEAEEIISKIKKKYYDATHRCFAYRLLDGKQKYSDDGEPNGTAGIRILNAIEHFELNNILLVVIRYFGGTKLGVGPLGKTYYRSAFSTLENAKIILKEKYKKIKIMLNYSFSALVFRILSNSGSKIISRGYETGFTIDAYVKVDSCQNVKDELINETKGKVSFVKDDSVVLL